MINQKKHWETLAQKNSKYYINSDFGKKITEEQFRQSGLETYQRFIANDKLLVSRESILDFGCGSGRLTEFMAPNFKKVYGVDISRTMINEAQERLHDLMNIHLAEIDGVHIPLADCSIDVVFSYLVFQHIKTRAMVEDAFSEIFRVLKPNGLFKVLMRSDKQKDMKRWWSGVEYSPEAIAVVYEAIGFKGVKSEPVDKYAYWLWLKK
jgi:ubiquinone/menaquinone biosynthesis C-methylase UbiE